MPRTEGRRTYNSFVKGIITEASGINYPENASVDEANFELYRNGSRQRRLGFDLESSFVNTDVSGGAASGYQFAASNTYFWDNTGPGNQFDLLCVQYGSRLYFYDTTGSSFGAAINFGGQAYYDITPHTTGSYTGSNFEKYQCGFALIKGALVVVGRHIDPFYLEVDDADDDGVLDTLTGTGYLMYIRDFDGVKSTAGGAFYSALSGGELTHESASLDLSHEYNLKNQGWDQQVYDFAETYGSAATRGALINPISDYGTANSIFPGNNRFLYYNFKQDGPYREWDAAAMKAEEMVGNAEAPKGHFLLDPWVKNRNGVDVKVAWINSGSLGGEVEKNRPSVVASFAGRVWYSGVESDITITASTISGTPTIVKGGTNSTKIFFTRTIVNLDRLGQCYQQNDPTSESLNELLPNDGGVVDIHDAGLVLQLVSTGTSIFALCTNGVWEITGSGDGVGFSASNYKINRISNVGAVSSQSAVVGEGQMFYWGEGGIYMMRRSEIGDWGIANVSDDTIQTLFTSINYVNRTNALGFYDSIGKKVRWLYSSGTQPIAGRDKWDFDRELIFDLTLGAFYKHHIATSSTHTIGNYAPLSGQFTVLEDLDIIAGDLDVYAGTSDVVETTTVQGNRGALSNKYLVIKKDGSTPIITFGEYGDTGFVDWEQTGTSVDYTAYIIAGYEVFGDPSMTKQATSITSFFNKTEDGYVGSNGDLAYTAPSGCYLQARWDWSDSGDSGKWSQKEQVYRISRHYVPASSTDSFANGLPVVATKTRVRGSGRALSVYYESEAGKDCWLLGWTVNAEGRQGT